MQFHFPGGAATDNNYDSIVSPPAWLYTDSFTIRCWAYRDVATTPGKAIAFAQNLFLLHMTNTQCRFSIIDDGAVAITHAGVAHTDYNQEWVFIAASWDRATNAMTIVVQSESKARTAGTATKTPGTHTPGTLFWGKNKLAGDGSSAFTSQAWDGPVLGLMISKGAATQAQLEALVDEAWTEFDPTNQPGLLDPTVPITYEGTGIGGLLNPQYIGMVWGSPQTIDGTPSFDGARANSNVTTAQWCVLINDGNTSYNDVESNVLCQYKTHAILGSVLLENPDPAFFGKPSPALGTDGNNGVASNLARRLKANTPSGVEFVEAISNSRGAIELGYDGGPAIYGEWGGCHAHGHAASRIAKLGGFANVYLQSTAQKRYHPIFPCTTSGFKQSGSFTNTHNSGGTYGDFSRDWSCSGIANSTGPGRGCVFNSTGALLSQRATLNANTLFNGATQLRHVALYEKYPGSPSSATWEIRDAATPHATGTVVASGTLTGLNTALQTHTYNTTNDTYNAGTKTLTLQGLTTTGLAVGHYVFNATSKARGKITTLTPGGTVTVVLEFALRTAPLNGEVLHFGPYEVGILDNTINAPTGGDVCQGYEITANTGFVWLGVTAHAVGIDCWVFGAAGKNGGGIAEQLAQAHSGTIAYRVSRVGYTGMLMHGATQFSSNADRMAYAAVTGLTAPNCIFCSDQVHKIDDTTFTGTWNTDALAQSTYPAIVATNYCGTLMWQFANNMLRNPAHPAIEGMKMLADGIWGTASDGIPEEEPEPEPDPEQEVPSIFSRARGWIARIRL